MHIDQTGSSLYAYRPNLNGIGVDSVKLDQSTRQTTASFDTPIKIGGFTWTNAFRFSDALNDFPFTKTVFDPADSSKKQTITYDRDFLTTVDWTTGINLPSFFQSTWKLTPSVSFENVDPHAFMYGQMTAGSWIYIGSQGILQGTYETFGSVARRHFAGTLAGRFVLTAGLGGMGGAQPLAATLNGAAFLGVEVDESRIDKRLATRYLDRKSTELDEALAWIREAVDAKRPLSVGLVGNAATVIPELVRRGVTPDVLTDQTSAHDTLNGYVPNGLTLRDAADLRRSAPQEYIRRATDSIVAHVKAMLELQRRGAVTFDYGNNIRTVAFDAGVRDAFAFPGFVPEYIRPLFCEGKGPFRWVALSGDPEDIYRTDELVLELFSDNEHLRRWIEMARGTVQFQGLPARICWLGQGERARFGVALNDLVARGKLSAPIVIGRDHLDTGSVASPFRETEAMKDGSDAIADWAILNALVNVASGASWVSFHHGGGVGIGNSLHGRPGAGAHHHRRAHSTVTRFHSASPEASGAGISLQRSREAHRRLHRARRCAVPIG